MSMAAYYQSLTTEGLSHKMNEESRPGDSIASTQDYIMQPHTHHTYAYIPHQHYAHHNVMDKFYDVGLPLMDSQSYDHHISPGLYQNSFTSGSSHNSPFNTSIHSPISPLTSSNPVYGNRSLEVNVYGNNHNAFDQKNMEDHMVEIKPDGRHQSSSHTGRYASNTHTNYPKRQGRTKEKKRCSNCYATKSPSWRRSNDTHTKGELLCNACGLYEKTARTKRMLVTYDDDNVKVVRKRDTRNYCCTVCNMKNFTRWRMIEGKLQCERCARPRS
ncbi:hypothetical protein BDB01DRAFT_153457 [Pilobolus umbonatus]|nr:hypothetical protein BDB01DRAFT_153457 [Pilobolus umbonatus]